MSAKTHEQIQEQITKLEALRDKVCPFTAFGDDNLAALDAVVQVLRDGDDTDSVYLQYGPPNELSKPGEWDDHVLQAALHASDWMFGRLAEDEEAPAEGWPLKGGV